MEHLIEYGVENIMAIEFAGCLQRDVAMEDIIVQTRPSGTREPPITISNPHDSSKHQET